MFGRKALSEVFDEGKEFLTKNVRNNPEPIKEDDPTADLGIKQHDPQPKQSPLAEDLDSSKSKDVYQKVCDEWKKICDPETGFEYFCAKYVYISNQRHGYVNFKLYDYQKRIIKQFDDNRFLITRKFRQAGASLVFGIKALHYSLTHSRMETMVLSMNQRSSSKFLNDIREVYESLPQFLKGGLDNNGKPIKWMRKKAKKDSATELWLPNKAKIRSIPSGKAKGRGFSTKMLIIDEAAFIDGIEETWTGLFPTIVNTNGKVVVISTVNGTSGQGGWYHNIYKGAEAKENDFVIAEMHYKEHPDYNDPEWESQTFRQLGQRKWDQEVLGKFLASGNTFIDALHLEGMEKLLDSYEKPKIEMGGKLLVWKEFEKGCHYSIGADCSTGGGLDSSCAQVFKVETGEQVAEYKAKVPEDTFASVLAQLGYRYGTALICPELNSTAGGAVITSLIKEQKYKRVYKGADDKYGWNTNMRTRNLMISELESNLYANSWKIYSPRLIDELKTFIVTKSGKIEHDSNAHDDCIFAWLIATAPEIVRAALRSAPKQPNSVLLVKEEEEPDKIFSKPIYDEKVNMEEMRKKRSYDIAGTKYGDFVEKMEVFKAASGEEDILSWLMSSK